MRIIVCIKPNNCKYLQGEDKWSISGYDLYAISMALEIKKNTNSHITCICMGPYSSIEVLYTCISYGIDDTILLCDDTFAGSDTYSTTYILLKAIEKINKYDLILCGNRSSDGETGQVPIGLAERLGVICVPFCEELVSIEYDKLIVNKDTGKCIQRIECELPVIISFNGFVTDEPKTNLQLMKKARQKDIKVWDATLLGAEKNMCGMMGSKTKVVSLRDSFTKRTPIVLNGDARNIANAIYEIIKGEI